MPSIETLLLANHAEVREGLLNLLGGGWSEYTRHYPAGEDPPVSHFGVALTVLVPWTETNRQHHFQITIATEDGELIGPPVEGGLEMGRAPGVPHGIDQRAILAINADYRFPRPGGYVVAARVGEQDPVTVSFRVKDEVLTAPGS